MKVARFTAVLVVLCLAAACGGSTATSPSTTPSTPSSTPLGSEFFAGTLALQGTNFFTFDVTTAGTVNATLNSLTTSTTVPVTNIAVAIGLGAPSADGTSCEVSASTTTVVGLTTHVTIQGAKGTNCVQISDMGNLVVPLTFVVRVAHS